MTALESLIFFIIKALLVLGGLYVICSYLLKEYFDGRMAAKAADPIPSEKDPQVTALRLQAYERLHLMIDRFEIGKVLQRVIVPDMALEDIKGALFVAIQQEYDHNVSQQIYVSEKLWDIILAVKDNQLARISAAIDDAQPGATSSDLIAIVYKDDGEREILTKARKAIATEARSILLG